MLKKYLGVVLEDDSADIGGVAFEGETVRDFLEDDIDRIENITLAELNDSLIMCGIKPIKEVM